MNWINKLERKFGKYAIKNLMLYIIALYVLGIIINIWTPAVYDTFLALDAQKILHGQIWRIVTFIIQPPSNTSIIFLFFVLYFVSATLISGVTAAALIYPSFNS